jgi:hypothetical protein
MSRSLPRSLAVAALLALAAAGCSRQGQKEQRAEWRSAAEKACLRAGQVRETPYIKVAKALEGPGPCGADHPFKVAAFTMDAPLTTASAAGLSARADQGSGFFSRASATSGLITRLNQESVMTCPMVAAVDNWLEKVVQPAALARFGQPVVELRTMGTYSCRRMNNGGRSARMSEHAFANAIDIGGFRLTDGTVITVLRGWKGGEQEQFFLREVHAGACRNFATVLGPGADAFHYDHLHFDLARHGRTGSRSICRPSPQAVPPPNEGFPIDPAKAIVTSDARGALDRGPRAPEPERHAFALAPRAAPVPPAPVGSGPILPGWRPPTLPAAPRNPIAEREARELAASPRPAQRPAAPPLPAGPPVMLYGKGHGPFLPLEEHEIDPMDLDEVTGSVGE